MESTLLTLTVQTRDHCKFIAATNTPSSREEWMDPRISLEVGQTMFWASVQSGVSSGLVCMEKIHCLTTRTARTEMRIDMADFRGDKKYAYYNFFMVGNAASKYKLQVAGYNGTAGDSILYGSTHGGHNLNGMAFTTHDNDNDLNDSGNCAQGWKGGWWYNNCMCSQLNAIYHHDTTPASIWEAVVWTTFTTSGRSLKFAEMKLRARD